MSTYAVTFTSSYGPRTLHAKATNRIEACELVAWYLGATPTVIAIREVG